MNQEKSNQGRISGGEDSHVVSLGSEEKGDYKESVLGFLWDGIEEGFIWISVWNWRIMDGFVSLKTLNRNQLFNLSLIKIWEELGFARKVGEDEIESLDNWLELSLTWIRVYDEV